MRYASTPRRGLALVAALTLMATAATLIGMVTLQIVAQRDALRRRQHQLQAEWLARSGVELAASRLLEKPAAFTEDRDDLAPGAKLRIAVKKVSEDTYLVVADAETGQGDGPPVSRSAAARFRRTEEGGAVRLQALPPAGTEEHQPSGNS